MKEYLRLLPPVHEIQKDHRFLSLGEQSDLSSEKLTQLLQDEINSIRNQLLKNEWTGEEPTKQVLLTAIFNRLEKTTQSLGEYFLQKVINATGTILHTNLGRAKLSQSAIKHVTEIASNYSNLEYKIDEGKRGSRHDIIEELIQMVTGAEAAMVVNNNAAAVYLILRALAKEKEVIVSRGQLVEIGGSFRISSIMEESGAHLVEIGTTNKTHIHDYEHAVTDETKMIMKVHTSNFKTIGFTKSVSTEDLIELTNKYENIIFYEDLGSGVLYDFRKHGIGDEPVVSEVLAQGADLVSFSGDKLLGGPQAGIIAGKKEFIQLLKKHQLARVLRVDKLTLAALEATLSSYLRENALIEIPVIKDMLVSQVEIKKKAEQLVLGLQMTPYEMKIENDVSQVGGGTMPDVELPTYIVSLKHEQKNAETLSKELRLHKPSIVTRVKQDRVLLDCRTIQDDEVIQVLNALQDLL